MTPFERDVLKCLALRGRPLAWSELRNQFVVSEGALAVVVNSLKRKLLIRQDGTAYALTEPGRAALEPRPHRVAFGGEAW